MKKHYLEIQKNVFSKEFNRFYRKELVKNLYNVEKIRKKYLFIIMSIISCAILYVFGALFFIIYNNYNIFQKGVLEIIIFVPIILIAIAEIIKKSYKNKAKDVVLEKLLSFIGEFKRENDTYDRVYIESLKLFDKFNRFSCDDRLIGKYGLIDIDIQELDLRFVTGSGKNRHERLIFQGILIKAPSLKKYDGFTVIRKHSILPSSIGERVHLEDIEFEKYYDVYSNNQVEARYLITTSFMERMVQLAKHNIADNIQISFEHGNVNIAVSSSKDWFEVPIMKPAMEISNYSAIILELITLLKIIDSLRLEQNIGL